MALHRPTELLNWLNQENLIPNRKLSQNFLIDAHIVEKIVQLANLEPQQRVIEIGPGPGVVTEYLLQHGHGVSAIEADTRLGQLLPRLGPVQVLQTDALKLDWEAFLSEQKLAYGNLCLISNLPYHLSTPLLRKLLPLGNWVHRLVLMVQKEFAQRLQAHPGSKQYGPLSILMQYYGHLAGQFNVSANCFYPRPRVQSCVLRIDLKPRPQEASQMLESLIDSAFMHRRKTLNHLIQTLYPKLPNPILAQFSSKRAEQLTLEQWIQLSDALFENAKPKSQQLD